MELDKVVLDKHRERQTSTILCVSDATSPKFEWSNLGRTVTWRREKDPLGQS